ncbi:MAG TPA: PRC-barrel domain-containing protein [Methanobacterium sp.]|nr:PRC-barrel domain-containing protein [Methanobacterium sp.]
MQIVEDLIGKEAIDDSGNIMGIVKDVVWDFEANHVESIVVEERSSGLSSIMGSKPKQFISYEHIYSIGDKILVSIKIAPAEPEEEDSLGLGRFNLNF